MTLKKSVLAAATTLATATADSTPYCNGGAANATVAVAAGRFLAVSFVANCSANVYTEGIDGTTYYQAGGASAKGSRAFMASSVGGAVRVALTCAATGCTAANAATAASSAPSS